MAAAVGVGTAFVGNVGAGSTRDYSAIGPIVDQVSRLAGHARPGEILALPEVRASLSDRMAGAIPRTIEGAERAEPIHAWSIRISGEVVAEIAHRDLATILFLDLVGSTDINARIGDAAWRDLLVRHYAELRRLLHVHDGTEIDTAGDGLLATFRAPAEAIAFGRAAIAADDHIGLGVRVGLHTGEVEHDRGAIRGIAVVIAARIAALAGAGQILVSSTVRELAAGSTFVFVAHGSHVLKGVPDAREVYEVEATPAR